jgi:hypothetical protein
MDSLRLRLSGARKERFFQHRQIIYGPDVHA